MLPLLLGTIWLLAAAPGGASAPVPDAAEAAAADSAAAEEPEAPAEADSSLGAPHEAGSHGPDAAALADTSLRVTGTHLRFGYTPEMASRFGEFPIAKVPGMPREVARRGPLTWFGVESEATLFFRSGHLVRAQFTAKKVPPHSGDYIQDELARQGFKRTCEGTAPPPSGCTWRGRTILRFTTGLNEITVVVQPAPRPKPAPVAAAPPAPAFVPERDVFVLGKPGVTNAFPDPEFEVRPDPKPLYPKAARDAGIQGNVWIRASVDSVGRITSTKVVKSIAQLDAAALEAVKIARFRPYSIAGRPTRFEVEFPVRFLLH